MTGNLADRAYAPQSQPHGRRAIARVRTSAMRVCQPGPVAFHRASVSGGRRSEMALRALSLFGRPGRRSNLSAAAAPTRPGKTSLAGRARANCDLDHSGFSRLAWVASDFFFISFPLTTARPPQTDYVHRPGTRREHHCVQRPFDEPECLESSLAIVPAQILDDQGSGPVEKLDDLKGYAALAEISVALRGVEADVAHGLYICIYVISMRARPRRIPTGRTDRIVCGLALCDEQICRVSAETLAARPGRRQRQTPPSVCGRRWWAKKGRRPRRRRPGSVSRPGFRRPWPCRVRGRRRRAVPCRRWPSRRPGTPGCGPS